MDRPQIPVKTEKKLTVVSEIIFIFRVNWEQKHTIKKLSENAIQLGIEPGSPDNMLRALNRSLRFDFRMHNIFTQFLCCIFQCLCCIVTIHRILRLSAGY